MNIEYIKHEIACLWFVVLYGEHKNTSDFSKYKILVQYKRLIRYF